MNSHIENHIIEIETVGPLFVGSGQNYGKKEIIFDTYNKKVHIPNAKKMAQYFMKNSMLRKYEEFMFGYEKDFGKWLYKNNIKKDIYEKWIDYTLDGSESDMGNAQVKQVAAFVKDPFQLPYVPGSSLKGAIRTILLASEIIQNKSSDREYNKIADKISKAEFRNRKNYLNFEMKELESKVFNTRELNDRKQDAINDVMAGIRISDSKPLSQEDLILCQKIDVAPNGESNRMPILRECIRPGVKIKFMLTIDASITSILVGDIIEAINIFLDSYNESFDSKFKNYDDFDKNVIYLGGGSGFVSKTILYPLLGSNAVSSVSKIIENTLPSKMKNEHKHYQDVRKGVSPHTIKKTMYADHLLSFGACKIKID